MSEFRYLLFFFLVFGTSSCDTAKDPAPRNTKQMTMPVPLTKTSVAEPDVRSDTDLPPDTQRIDVYWVTGRLTKAGKPLQGRTIVFSGVEGQPVAFGKTDANGRFILTTYDENDGAAAGRYKVILSRLTGPYQPGKKMGLHDDVAEKYASLYTTPLMVRVARHENELNLEID